MCFRMCGNEARWTYKETKMKVTVAMLAGLMAAGFLSAASVTGNNHAVVVQKEIRASSTGWQFICVPVNAFDITGGTGGSIDVTSLFPTSIYNEGAQISILAEDGTFGGKPNYTLTMQDGALTWVQTEGAAALKPGDILWLKNGGTTGAEESDVSTQSGDTAAAETQITYCGQARTRTAPARGTSGAMTPMKNDGAEAIGLSDIVEGGPQTGDQVLVIKAGSANYLRYRRTKTAWKAPDGTTITDTEKPILAGEAFYYYAK